MKELTGAEMKAMAEQVPLLEAMTPGGKPHPLDRIIHYGNTVTLGGEILIGHLTPGRSSGCANWEIDVQETGQTYSAVIICSVGVNPSDQLYNNPNRSYMVEDYRSSYAKLRAVAADIPLGSHPSMYNINEKYPRPRLSTSGAAPHFAPVP